MRYIGHAFMLPKSVKWVALEETIKAAMIFFAPAIQIVRRQLSMSLELFMFVMKCIRGIEFTMQPLLFFHDRITVK